MYSGSVTTKMKHCRRCNKHKHRVLFGLVNYPNSLHNVICEKCLSKGFVNAYTQLLKISNHNTLINNIPLIEVQMYSATIKKQ